MSGAQGEAGRRGSLAGDAFIVAVLCLIAIPLLLLTAPLPWLSLALGAVLAVTARRWPVAAGPVPRIVTALIAVVALLAAALAFLA
ncbi:MAG: hypothetical protein LCI03_05960 [Actinobacteria bacterium]|nr:hypothetical protein [Actinomycetota bacterium]